MPEKLIKKIRTADGDLPIDYNALANLPDLSAIGVQADWEQNDETQKDFIKNKPTLGQVAALEEIGKDNLSTELKEELNTTKSAAEQAQSTADEAKAGLDTHTHSWNNLADKPFGEGVDEIIVFDGIVGDKTTVSFGYAILVKVSDKVFSITDLIGSIVITNDGSSVTLAENMLAEKDSIVGGASVVFSVSKENAQINASGTIIPETGTYFVANTELNQYVQSLTLAGGGIKTLDEKFIPDTIARVTPATVSLDMSAFDADGVIIETFADGSTKTTTMEFDANGNPIKITDTNGNVTILTWGG